MSNAETMQPEMGMGATLVMWTDRHPYTIVGLEHFKTGSRAGEVKALFATRDKATRTDDHGMSDAQSYTYETDPDAPRERFVLCKDGWFRQNDAGGTRLAIGHRRKYHDYSF